MERILKLNRIKLAITRQCKEHCSEDPICQVIFEKKMSVQESVEVLFICLKDNGCPIQYNVIEYKDSLSIITADKIETPEERDMRADLTLLSVTINLSPKEIKKFLIEFNVPHNEYVKLTKKYSRIIERYKEELLNGNIDELTGILKNNPRQDG